MTRGGHRAGWVGLLAACVLAPLSAHAELWATAGGRAGSLVVAAVDAGTLVQTDGVRSGWLYWVTSAPDGGIASVRSMRYWWKCDTQQRALRQWADHDPTTLDVRGRGTPNEALAAPTPAVTDQAVLQFVCAYDIGAHLSAPQTVFTRVEGSGPAPILDFAERYFGWWVSQRR